MSNLRPPPVHRIIVAQLAVSAILAVLFLIFSNVTAAYSILIGGLISAVSNGFFTMQAFRYRGARNADKVVRSFIKGEMGKLTITLILFALVFTLLGSINEAALIGGFLAVHVAGIVMSGMINYSPGNS